MNLCVKNYEDALLKFAAMLALNTQSNRGYNFGQEASSYLWRVYIMKVYETLPDYKLGADFEGTVTAFLRSVGFNAARTGNDDRSIDIVVKKKIQETAYITV